MPWRTKVMEIIKLCQTWWARPFPLFWQASCPYNFHMQCPISTKFLRNVDSLALNTSTHSFKVGHFEFGGLYEILPHIILSHLRATDWTPQTSQSVSILLGRCQRYASTIFILRHTCWQWRCPPLKSFVIKHQVLITPSYYFLSRPNLSGI